MEEVDETIASTDVVIEIRSDVDLSKTDPDRQAFGPRGGLPC
jgi:hypothetical protein